MTCLVRSWRNANVPLRVRRSTRSPGMDSIRPPPGAALAKAAAASRYLRFRDVVLNEREKHAARRRGGTLAPAGREDPGP